MIVREIKEYPDKTLSSFDYLNDYKDSRQWCVKSAPELVERLDDCYRQYLSKRYLT